MKKKTALLTIEDDFLLDLTLHNMHASLLAEFAERIVQSYYAGNLNAAIQDLIRKALTEQAFVLLHITILKVAKST